MRRLNRKSLKFISDYSEKYPVAQLGAKLASEIIERALKDTRAFVHVISGRAKKPESLRGKLRKKNYTEPQTQLTDLIGVRVIAYYSDDVEPIVARLRAEFEISEADSVDKRGMLELSSFGYRSVHLIARLARGSALSEAHKQLQDNWFEIQIRSLLEHAWAEIEHEVVYKSGIEFPDAVKRRFARLAGMVELLDGEFLRLREEREQLVEEYRSRYEKGQDKRVTFDVARLLGFLRSERPSGAHTFATHLEVSCLEALRAAGLGTATSLRSIFVSPKFRYAMHSFASLQGIAPAEVSHLAAIVLAVIVKKPKIVRDHFPEIIYDSSIAQIVERRSRQNGKAIGASAAL